MPPGHRLDRIHDAVAHLPVEGHELARIRKATAGRRRVVAAVFAGQEATGQRAPDQDADVVVLGERLELVLEASAHEAVVHLRGHVSLESQALLHHERGGRLPGHEVGQPDVADLSLTHEVVQRPQGLLERGVAVPSVHLVQVDVVGLEATQTAFHLAQDVHAGGAAPIEVAAHGQPDLRGQHDVLPDALQGVAQESLALAEAVHVGGVDQVDAVVQGHLHHPRGVLLAQVAHVHLAAELHAAQRHLAHDESGMSKFSVLHPLSPFRRTPTTSFSIVSDAAIRSPLLGTVNY